MPFKSWPPGGCNVSGCTCTSTPPPGPGNMPGCSCQGAPETLSVTVQYSPGESASTYGNAFRDGTLRFYYPSPPPYLAAGSGTPLYFSTATWLDDYGFVCHYVLGCNFSQFYLALSQTSPSDPGYPSLNIAGGPDGSYQRFNLGATSPFFGTNACTPFNLPFGVIPPGSSIRFRVST